MPRHRDGTDFRGRSPVTSAPIAAVAALPIASQSIGDV
jgi:hypothetical protein